MKKKLPIKIFPKGGFRRKILLFMKLTTLLLFAGLLNVSASIYSQTTKVFLTTDGESIKQVFKQIENQTKFKFLYNDEYKDLDRQVRFNIKSSSIEDVLSTLLNGGNLTYKVIENNLIVITPASNLQSVKIIGSVTDAGSGDPLFGVTIKIEGSSMGVITDSKGRFSISVPNSNAVLIFSYMGYVTQKIPVSGVSEINIKLVPEVQNLQTVVVTALNISRDKKSLGYSVQQIKGEDLIKGRPADLTSALVGKISGIQVGGSASSTFDDSKIRIRGINDMGGNGPLYVVDGTPISHSDIDMESVASISVLKGPSAAALYGQRASRGVVLITTKSGDRNKPMSIEINSSVKFESIRNLPKVQNLYAQGTQSANGEEYQFPVFKFDPSIHPQSWQAWDGNKMLEYNSEMSWGPKINGQLVRQFNSWYPNDPDYGKMTPLTAQPNNIKDFYRTGITLQNDFSVSGGTDRYNTRIGYSNQQRSLIYPGSDRNRHFFDVAGSYDINNKFTISTNINIVRDYVNANPNRSANVTNTLESGFPRQLDINKLRNYTDGQFRYTTWNLINPNTNTAEDFLYNKQISSNIFTEAFDNVGTDELTRIYGNVQMTYKIMDNLKIQGTYRTDFNSGTYDYKVVTGSRPINSDGSTNDYYSKSFYNGVENNYEALLSYNKRLGSISIDGNFGGNIRSSKNQSMGVSTNGGLIIPGIYAITNSAKKTNNSEGLYQSEVRSIYGRVSLGFKDFLYLESTLRNDWSSTLLMNNNSYLYPSVTTSFVFSKFMEKIVSKDLLSFGKLRFGIAQVGSDMGAYNIYTTMPLTTSYGNDPAQGFSSRLLNPNIRPTLSTSYEGGIELKFLKNRIGVEFSAYKNINKDQILEMAIPTVSGYNSMMVNAGLIETKGYDLSITASPVKTKDITWDISFNLGKTKSIVKKLAEGQKDYRLVWEFSNMFVDHIEGEEWSMMSGRKIKHYQALDAKGNPIYDPNNGKMVVSEQGQVLYDENQKFGSVLPRYTGGFSSSYTYKNIDFSFTADFQIGGLYFAKTEMLRDYKGISERTAALNDKGINIREPLSLGGGIKPLNAVTPSGVPFNNYVPAMAFYGTYWWLTEPYIYDATYVKMREIRIGYTLPQKWFSKVLVKGLNIGIVSNNAFLIYNGAKDSGKDPSEANRTFGDSGQLPSTRTFGFNVKVNL